MTTMTCGLEPGHQRGNFRKLTAWTKTVAELGLGGLHFHDLRLGSILYAREHQNGQPVRPGQRFW